MAIKFSVFIKNSGDPRGWQHWGYFDTRRDARDEAKSQRQFGTKTRIRNIEHTATDFAAMAEAMNVSHRKSA